MKVRLLIIALRNERKRNHATILQAQALWSFLDTTTSIRV
jgi:hypothetical protein